MTTVAFDGLTMAADTLCTDFCGLKDSAPDKIMRGLDFMAGAAGNYGQILRWWATVKEANLSLNELLRQGYPDYEPDKNEPNIMLTDGRKIWRLSGCSFVECSRSFYAIGSGRDYALAAMHLGKTARKAVEVAMHFDNNTGGDILAFDVKQEQTS